MKISATAEEDKILQIFRNRDVVTRKDVESEFNISKSTALRILSSLDKKGIIAKKGAGRDASYMLKNKKNQ